MEKVYPSGPSGFSRLELVFRHGFLTTLAFEASTQCLDIFSKA